MAKKDDGRVTVIAGDRFMHERRAIFAGDVLRVTPSDAADLKAMRLVRDPKPEDDERLARDLYNRRDMRARP